jgi:hypothetical protein
MPNFGLIEAYMRGTRLPAPDLWLYPFPMNCYYSFQHYAAALLGRLVGIGPGVTYHLAFCTMVGFITQLAGSCISRFCAWKPGQWLVVLSLLLGGCGIAVTAHLMVKEAYMIDLVRFVGGSIVRNQLTPLGQHVSHLMTTPGVEPRDLPMEPFSYFLTKGDFHPPLAGFLLLAFAAALIAAQETGASGARRAVNHGLLAATVPLALISNAWIVPLQALLVFSWFGFCLLRGERRCWRPAAVGLAAVVALAYPFLLEFTQQPIGNNAAIGRTAAIDHTPLLGWLIIFWPVVGILLLAPLNRERRGLALYLLVVWALALAGTECFYNHDLYGGSEARFNSALKWWQWVYAGIVLTSGALAGTAWLDRDIVVRDIIVELRSRPDGVTLESGLIMANSESPAVSLFSDKQSLLGWPWLEEAWRGPFLEVQERLYLLNHFYAGDLVDPLAWLLHNNVKYIYWHHCYGNDRDFAVGFWERIEPLGAK